MMTNKHISEENLMGYIYRTLSDAERESFDEHLSDCPTCQTRLVVHELRQRQINDSLETAINGVSPSRKMNFAAIAPQLQRSRIQIFWPRISTAVPIPIAIIGLLFSLYGLWQVFGSLSLSTMTRQPGALPTLACFCLMFVSMIQLDRSYSIRPRFIITVSLAFILWLGTAVIGLLNVLVIRDLVLMACITAGSSNAETSVAAILAVLVSTLIYITAVIGGAEYHYRHIGQPSSWKLFTWTIVIQLLIMILPYLTY